MGTERGKGMTKFEGHRGYSAMFKEGRLTLGLFFAIESYQGAVPEMDVAKRRTHVQAGAGALRQAI